MRNTISVDDYYQLPEDHILIDVRSPSEYIQGHITSAINLPLFTDEERKIVGTTHKKRGSEAAMMEGLEIVGPKMKTLAMNAKKIANNNPVYIYCWRGGKRSESMRWLLDMAGIQATQIIGGYKSMRSFMTTELSAINKHVIILSGATGSGKTEILHALQSKGEQIIDLEGLANHKGSSFGGIGQADQPSSEQFNNNIYAHYRQLNISKRVWIENESRTIGRVFIAEDLWAHMQGATTIELNVPENLRVEFLIEQYGHYPIEELAKGFERITKRMGGQHTKHAIESLASGDLATATKLALVYYDKAYLYSRKKRQQVTNYELNVVNMDFNNTADELITFATGKKL